MENEILKNNYKLQNNALSLFHFYLCDTSAKQNVFLSYTIKNKCVIFLWITVFPRVFLSLFLILKHGKSKFPVQRISTLAKHQNHLILRIFCSCLLLYESKTSESPDFQNFVLFYYCMKGKKEFWRNRYVILYVYQNERIGID